MAAITSTGIGSGLDVSKLVSSLVAAEGAGKASRLNKREAEYTAKLSSLSALKGAVSDFQSSYTTLKTTSTFTALTASPSDSTIFTVTAEKAAVSGSYDIDVTQLAVAQKLQTATGFSDSDSTSIGTGTMTFEFASDIAAGNNKTSVVTITDGTLQGIRNAINSANIGVNANIVFDGSNYQMVLTSQTGKDNELKITQSSTTGDLSAFEYDSDSAGLPAPAPTGNLTQSITAADANLTVDGVIITSASNTISNILTDVTLTLKNTGIGEKLTIGKNTSGIGTAVQGFVDGYNTLMTTLNEASAFSENGSNGILIGDSSVRGIVSQLRNILNTTIGDTTTKYNSMGSIGILTKRDGTLEYDTSKLSTALTEDPIGVQHLLAGGRTSINNSDVTVITLPDDFKAGSYSFEVQTSTTLASYTSDAPGSSVPNRYNFDSASFDLTFSVAVDGTGSGTLSIPQTNFYLTSGSDTALAGQAVAAAIQSAINGDVNISGAGKSVAVSFAEIGGNALYTINSGSSGPSSSIGVSLSNILKSNIGMSTNLLNPAVGSENGSTQIGGIAATQSGTKFSGTDIFEGFNIKYTGSTKGVIGSIKVEDGLMDNLDILVSSFLDSKGIISAKTDGLNSSIASITTQRTDLDKRMASYEARLLKQFNAMDAMVSQLNSTSSFLTSQLQGLQNLSNSRR